MSVESCKAVYTHPNKSSNVVVAAGLDGGAAPPIDGNAGPLGTLPCAAVAVVPHNEAIVFSRSSSWIDLFFPALPDTPPDTPPPMEPSEVVHRSSNPPPPEALGFDAGEVATGDDMLELDVKDAYAGRGC